MGLTNYAAYKMSCAPYKLLIVKLITCVSVWAAQYDSADVDDYSGHNINDWWWFLCLCFGYGQYPFANFAFLVGVVTNCAGKLCQQTNGAKR